MIYGSLIHRGSIDPIEKKPLYHFWPGSNAFSIATIGCNFRCQHCQNWEISQAHPNDDGTRAEFGKIEQKYARPFELTEMTPEQVIIQAKKSSCHSIAYTYNEPTIWYEFVRDCAKLAKENEIKNVLVTNGYSSQEANKEFIKYIDAANIDIKSFDDSFYKRIVGVPNFEPVLATIKYFFEQGIHIELTNLIIPGENDNLDDIREMTKWIKTNLDPEVPLHFSAYHPSYRMDKPRTNSRILNEAWKIAKEEGLLNIFIGNVTSNRGNNSYCHKCNSPLIERNVNTVINKNLTESGNCGKCGEISNIRGNFIESKRYINF